MGARSRALTSCSRPTAAVVGGVQVGLVVAEDVGEQGDGVPQVIEHHDDVGEQEGHVGQTEVVGRRGRQMLHVPHTVIAEVAHRAAHEGRHLGQRRSAIAAEVLLA